MVPDFNASICVHVKHAGVQLRSFAHSIETGFEIDRR